MAGRARVRVWGKVPVDTQHPLLDRARVSWLPSRVEEAYSVRMLAAG